MTDERSGAGGKHARSAEEAKRFYQQPRETVARTAMSHYGAQGDGQAGGAAGGTRSDRQQHPDPQYHAWRESQVDAMDRDYDAFRARHTGDPAQAFGAWRKTRGESAPPPGGSGEDERSLALGERPDQGSDGPHILDRSFSGTYED